MYGYELFTFTKKGACIIDARVIDAVRNTHLTILLNFKQMIVTDDHIVRIESIRRTRYPEPRQFSCPLSPSVQSWSSGESDQQ